MCLAHPSSFEIALALLDHTQRGRKPVEPTLLQKRQSNVCSKAARAHNEQNTQNLLAEGADSGFEAIVSVT